MDGEHGQVVLEAHLVFVRAKDLAVVLGPADGQRLRTRHPSLHLHRLAHSVRHGLRGLLGEVRGDFAFC